MHNAIEIFHKVVSVPGVQPRYVQKREVSDSV